MRSRLLAILRATDPAGRIFGGRWEAPFDSILPSFRASVGAGFLTSISTRFIKGMSTLRNSRRREGTRADLRGGECGGEMKIEERVRERIGGK